MESLPKISIVTPNFNGATYLEETILSVLNQNYPNLDYIIIDGGSTDGSIEIIKKYEKDLAYWISEPDNGLYFGLQKGLEESTGEIMGWINSDDILHKRSLFAIADIFLLKEIQWIQGYPNVINEQSQIVYHRPPRYSKYAFYVKDYHDGNFIQQESTFWRRELWNKCGACISTEYMFAGDFDLWIKFFNHAKLYTTRTFLGSFRIRKGQLSGENYKKYLTECDEIISEKTKFLSIEDLKIIQLIQNLRKIKKFSYYIFKILRLNRAEEKYLNSPLYIEFDFKTNHYSIN